MMRKLESVVSGLGSSTAGWLTRQSRCGATADGRVSGSVDISRKITGASSLMRI